MEVMMKINKMYTKISEKHVLQTNTFKNACIAFISGGSMGAIAQILYIWFVNILKMSDTTASSYIILLVIVLTSILTGIGVYDKLAQKCGAGVFIPISGFANALTSCAMEYKNEGLIYGIGSNVFKLAGSVITYGIVSTYILGILRYLLKI